MSDSDEITMYPFNEEIDQNEFLSRIRWALIQPTQADKKDGVPKGKYHEKLRLIEKLWGNAIIGQTDNGNWTTKLGEKLVFDVLQFMGHNPRKITRKNGFEPDWESEHYIYEVKSSNWYVTGTAGEKVLGTFIKYRNVPEIYGKPLRIVCLAKQEYELTHEKTQYFGENLCPKIHTLLDLAKTWNIEYIPFSQLIREAGIDISLLQTSL